MAPCGEVCPVVVLALSCADKASNLRDMLRLNEQGHAVGAFTSRGHSSQLGKFLSLDRVRDLRGFWVEPKDPDAPRNI